MSEREQIVAKHKREQIVEKHMKAMCIELKRFGVDAIAVAGGVILAGTAECHVFFVADADIKVMGSDGSPHDFESDLLLREVGECLLGRGVRPGV